MMAILFEELDYQKTAIGDLVLRRRSSPALPDEVIYEVTIDGEMLMSSTVSASERALARRALDGRDDRPLDVLVGGLGLGCTAAAALEYSNVRKLVVVELLAPVIGWHRRRLVPLAERLIDDPRCALVEGDFFEHVRQAPAEPLYDAILLDIDHAPDCLLHQSHGGFYSTDGLRDMTRCLRPGGVFALWSAWRPQDEFFDLLKTVFPSVHSHEVSFFNPHINDNDSNWIIVAEGADSAAGTGRD
jgi:spermidine synthase